ncbi:MAG: DUF362 domain-containing protein [Elusimicrobiota bacterium]|jgi:uncharacterized protein (DUF362 family)/NAD-dependent dihydropyrimidine dehydrogenase PreA subunit|nr:DUF362 domain-containing protein [Elusimicrobiota bacterium]
MSNKISLVRCQNYKDAFSAVKKSIDLLGGIKKYIKSGEKILLKPNLLAPEPPEKAITTHPEIVRAVIKSAKEAGAKVFVGDSPGGSIRDIENLWKVTGLEQICKEEGAQLIQFEAAGAMTFDIGDKNIKRVTFSKAVLDCDGIINLPKLKTHSLMTFTGGVKNFYGCVPGLLKVEYHKYASKNEDFSALLTNIYLFLKDKIRFTLIDGILSMEGNGPSAGYIREMNLIAASDNTPLLDAVLMNAAGIDIAKNNLCRNFNIKKESLKDAEICGSSIADFNFSNFKMPKTRIFDKLPKPLVKILGKLLWIKPAINKTICAKCFLCARSCPAKTIKAGADGFPFINAKNCISCFCCHEMCPYKAVDFQKSFLAGIFIQDDQKKQNKTEN